MLLLRRRLRDTPPLTLSPLMPLRCRAEIAIDDAFRHDRLLPDAAADYAMPIAFQLIFTLIGVFAIISPPRAAAFLPRRR